ncbi:DUF1877 family protein [Undibacterium luofuense]|uniref:DUF1877 family protein n=1 Tax=Undibacterium luofuense TaxID=2828733 RepID=A0A941DHV6_9BURK|nr:DUF1877 family protein [Undibacterium luofuense]MBR7781038.1 DUF1877 family protein [Undibacterium luofuense]
MGIIAYYVHVDADQLKTIKEKPALVWNIKNDARFNKAEIIDVDKDWQILSWLASPNKRREQQQTTAMMRVMDRRNADELMQDDKKYDKAIAEECAKLGVKPENMRDIPSDPMVRALEGRGTEKQREAAFNFGFGGARVFPPEEVKIIAVSFSNFKESELNANFNRKEMHKFNVGGVNWLNENDTVLNNFLIPSFRKVSRFYQNAASLNHYVLVIYR